MKRIRIAPYTYEYGAVKKGTFLTTHSKMLAIIQKGKVPYIRYANIITHNTYMKFIYSIILVIGTLVSQAFALPINNNIFDLGPAIVLCDIQNCSMQF